MVRWLMFGILVWFAIRHLHKIKKINESSRGGKPDDLAIELVVCDHCGVRFNREEAVLSAGKFYCCVHHRDASICL